jgi:hypothetical protein
MEFEGLLVRINRQLEMISQSQHRLARQRTLLQEQATRLRLGASPLAVSLCLQEADALAPSDMDDVTSWGPALRLDHTRS